MVLGLEHGPAGNIKALHPIGTEGFDLRGTTRVAPIAPPQRPLPVGHRHGSSPAAPGWVRRRSMLGLPANQPGSLDSALRLHSPSSLCESAHQLYPSICGLCARAKRAACAAQTRPFYSSVGGEVTLTAVTSGNSSSAGKSDTSHSTLRLLPSRIAKMNVFSKELSDGLGS